MKRITARRIMGYRELHGCSLADARKAILHKEKVQRVEQLQIDVGNAKTVEQLQEVLTKVINEL